MYNALIELYTETRCDSSFRDNTYLLHCLPSSKKAKVGHCNWLNVSLTSSILSAQTEEMVQIGVRA